MTGASIGSASNTLNINVDNLTATASTGDMFFHEQNSVTLTNLTGANGRDVFVGAQQDITVNQISVTGSGAAGRVLLAAGRDVFATPGLTGTDAHITAQNIEVRAGGMDTTGGQIGTDGVKLRLAVPDTIPGGATNTEIPSPACCSSSARLDPISKYRCSLRSSTSCRIRWGRSEFGAAESRLVGRRLPDDGVHHADCADRRHDRPGELGVAAHEQREPVVRPGCAEQLPGSEQRVERPGRWHSLYRLGFLRPERQSLRHGNPPICLPRDQPEEEDSEAPAAANAASSGCASTTAQDSTARSAPRRRAGHHQPRPRVEAGAGEPAQVTAADRHGSRAGRASIEFNESVNSIRLAMPAGLQYPSRPF